jgi:iron complex transport system permease protein
MTGGADNRFLILGSALAGATLLSLADLVARLTLRPAELPIGIVTSAVGVPVFLLLLRRRQYVF